jgi:hypothetical protein
MKVASLEKKIVSLLGIIEKLEKKVWDARIASEFVLSRLLQLSEKSHSAADLARSKEEFQVMISDLQSQLDSARAKEDELTGEIATLRQDIQVGRACHDDGDIY